MSRTKHHGNTSYMGKDLWGKFGNVAGRAYCKDNRKPGIRRNRRNMYTELKEGIDHLREMRESEL